MRSIVFVVLFIGLLPAVSYGKEEAKGGELVDGVGVEALPHELRVLLAEEMRALQQGMVSIIPAYLSGEWDEVATIAGKMERSYILKQRLTKEQAKVLKRVLPRAFIQRDQQFHYLAGMLEHVAKNRKPELINFYFSEINAACVECHTAHATHRFPALKQKEVEAHSH